MRTRFIRNILALCFSVSAISAAEAQTEMRMDVPGSWSLGVTCGMSDLWGDVGTESVIDHYNNSSYFNNPHFMGGIFTRYSFCPALAARLSANFGTLYATDQWNYNEAIKSPTLNSDAVQRYERHQDIKDYIWEGSLLFEFEPLRMNPEATIAHRSAQPYLLAGVGVFHYTPYSSLDGQWIKISDLHLEGDGFPVAGMPPKINYTQICIPLGVGYKFDIGPHLNLGLEYQFRFTMTDYLDGVSGKYIDPKYFNEFLSPQKAAQATLLANKTGEALGSSATVGPGDYRGNPNNKDSYSTISIIFYYKVKNHKIPWYE
jgi:hypothetical protein